MNDVCTFFLVSRGFCSALLVACLVAFGALPQQPLALGSFLACPAGCWGFSALSDAIDVLFVLSTEEIRKHVYLAGLE